MVKKVPHPNPLPRGEGTAFVCLLIFAACLGCGWAAVVVHKPVRMIPITAAPKTLYLTETLAGSTQMLGLQDGGSAPTDATMTTGWIVGTVASGNYARQDSQTERASSAHTSTVQPDGNPDNTLGDCFVTTGTLTGTFASGNWDFSLEVRGITRATSTHDGNLRIRMYRSVNQNGSSPTEISSVQETSAYANLANSANQTLTLSWNPGSFSLTAEYLFIQIAHEITGAGNNANSDTHLRTGTANRIITSNFQ